MSIEIKELKQCKLIGISVFGKNPEELAWEKMRAWAKANIQNYAGRQYFGWAPNGQENEEYEYAAQIVLNNNEVVNDPQIIARDNPDGFFITGDVDYTREEMGVALEDAYFQMVEWLKESKKYKINMEKRPVFEEHIFNEKWTSGSEGLSGFKLWLPIEEVMQ